MKKRRLVQCHSFENGDFGIRRARAVVLLYRNLPRVFDIPLYNCD